jgi:hypothetical protein
MAGSYCLIGKRILLTNQLNDRILWIVGICGASHRISQTTHMWYAVRSGVACVVSACGWRVVGVWLACGWRVVGVWSARVVSVVARLW